MPRGARLPIAHTRVEYLILADHVEALNGKLYLMGGGWDTIFAPNREAPVKVSIACGVLIPYNETDEDHRLSITIASADGVDVAPALTAQFRSGRAPTLERGAPTHVPFAIQAHLIFPQPGQYGIKATIDSRADSESRLPFFVRQAQSRPG